MRIITGMHRSGTSLVAGLFEAANANLGDPASFYPADKWNPDGYFELPSIHAVNMPLIHGRFGRLSYLKLPTVETISRRGAQRSQLIASTAAEHDALVIKECRFSLTLATWLEHGAQVEGVVICLRDPRSVARSLRRRNRVPLRIGLGLWYEHNRRLLDATSNLPVWIVDYNELFSAATFATEMSGAFNLFRTRVSEVELQEMAQKVVKPHLRHNHGEPPKYPRKIEQLWRNMLEIRAAQFRTPLGTNSGDAL